MIQKKSTNESAVAADVGGLPSKLTGTLITRKYPGFIDGFETFIKRRNKKNRKKLKKTEKISESDLFTQGLNGTPHQEAFFGELIKFLQSHGEQNIFSFDEIKLMAKLSLAGDKEYKTLLKEVPDNRRMLIDNTLNAFQDFLAQKSKKQNNVDGEQPRYYRRSKRERLMSGERYTVKKELFDDDYFDADMDDYTLLDVDDTDAIFWNEKTDETVYIPLNLIEMDNES